MEKREWARGRRLGVDVGSVRIGVAICDPDGILATPLVTVARDADGWAALAGSAVPGQEQQAVRSKPRRSRQQAATGPTDEVSPPLPADLAQLRALVDEHEVVGVVVGLPVTLAGTESYAAINARAYAQVLALAIDPVPVILTDERMSTAAAARRLSERGVRGGRRRALVDQAAAVEILQGWLDAVQRR